MYFKDDTIYPISFIEPLYFKGVKLTFKYTDLVITKEDDLKDHTTVLKGFIKKHSENTLDFNSLLLLRDIIKDIKPEILNNFDAEARFISKELGILCSSSQLKKVYNSKYFKTINNFK